MPNELYPKELDAPAFTANDESVINYKGRNYYRACDELVRENVDGSASFCVKRVGHPGKKHEDYDGNLREGWFCPYCMCHNHESITTCLTCMWKRFMTSMSGPTSKEYQNLNRY